MNFIRNNSENSLYLRPVTHFEVEVIVSNLDLAKTVSTHGISVNLLKILKRYISHSLAELVNQSCLEEIFPQS